MGIPLCVICCFSLADFNIFSFYLIFINLINMCLGMFHLWFILFGTLWVSWTWVTISFPILVFNSYLLKYFLMSFLFVFFFWDSYDLRSLRLSSFLLILFSSLLHLFISTILSSTSLILSFASVILLLIPSRVFLVSFIALFIID